MGFIAEFPQLLANGLIAGSIYALVAIGYTMVYGILKFINFAHGELFMLGAYFSYLFAAVLGLNIILSVFLSMVATIIVGVLIERVAYRPLRFHSRLHPLITALGISFFLQSAVLLIAGGEIKTFGYHFQPITLLGANVTPLQIVIAVTTIVLLIGLTFFVKFTALGKAMRAAADSYEVAQIIGINLDRVIMLVFAIGSGMAAIAGSLIGMEQNLQPTMGVLVGLIAFTSAVVGGIGSLKGAAVGGLLVGLLENFGAWFLPSGYKSAIAFVILIIVLFFKPTGVFGEKNETVVRS